MQVKTSEVKSEKKVVGEAEYPSFDTIEEAMNHAEYGIGEAKCLELINAQTRTNAMNIVRTNATTGPSKTALRITAMSDVTTELCNGQHPDAIGNETAVNRLVENRMAQLEAERAATAAVVPEDDE